MRRSTSSSSTNDRNALAEIRQSYLLRQSIIGNRYKNSKNPYFNIKPDYYDYRNVSDFRNYFIPERPALPYYVVPVLYVPQKVFSTEDIQQERNQSLLRRIKNQKQPQQSLEPDYEYQDDEQNDEQNGLNNDGDLDHLNDDLQTKSEDNKSYMNRTSSETESTVEMSSISSRFDEISETFKSDRFKTNYIKGFESGLNKYPIKKNIFGGETCKFNDSKKNLTSISCVGDQKMLNNSNNNNVFWKYKNPYTIFNKYPLNTASNTKSNNENNKNSPYEEGGFESDTKCNHFNETNGVTSKRKICIDCLKDKYLLRDFKNHRTNIENSTKCLQTVSNNFDFDEFEVFNNATCKCNRRDVEGDSKSTQTLNATKINCSTQTENEYHRKLTNRKLKGSQIPQRCTTNGFKSSFTELVNKQKNEKSFGSTSCIKRRPEGVLN